MRKLLLPLVCFSALTTGSSGQAPDTLIKKNFSIYPVPVVGYAPETRWYFGGVVLFTTKISGAPGTPNSTFDVEINYTQNKQFIAGSNVDMHFNRNRFRLIAENGYYKFPEDYWGLGITTTDKNKISYEATRLEFDNSFLIKNRKGYYIGIRYRYHYMNITGADDEMFFNNNNAPVYASGPGFRMVSDTRNNVLNASIGHYFSFSGLYFWKFLNNGRHFSRYEADARFYHSIKTNYVMALQVTGSAVYGNVPLRMTSMLGSESIMRGYYPGRYRDAYLAAVQGEFRMPVWKFIGVAAFAGSGTVFNNRTDTQELKFRPSYGGGLRLKIDRKENVNLRFDYGIGYKSEGFYVSFGEAF